MATPARVIRSAHFPLSLTIVPRWLCGSPLHGDTARKLAEGRDAHKTRGGAPRRAAPTPSGETPPRRHAHLAGACYRSTTTCLRQGACGSPRNYGPVRGLRGPGGTPGTGSAPEALPGWPPVRSRGILTLRSRDAPFGCVSRGRARRGSGNSPHPGRGAARGTPSNRRRRPCSGRPDPYGRRCSPCSSESDARTAGSGSDHPGSLCGCSTSS